LTDYADALDDLLDQSAGMGRRILLSVDASGGPTSIITTQDPDVVMMGDAANPDEYTNRYIYLPTAEPENQVRVVALEGLSITGGVASLTIIGTIDETLVDQIGYILAVDPDTLMNLSNDALEAQNVVCSLPLVHGPADAFMENIDATAWTGTATIGKQAIPTEVYSGARSLVVTDGGAGGQYAQSALNRVGQGQGVIFHAIAKADTGTSALVGVSEAGNEAFALEFDEETWLYLRQEVKFASSEELFRVRLEAVSAAAEGDWQLAGFVRKGELNFTLPSWVKSWNIRGLARVEFAQIGKNANTWLAGSRMLRELPREINYRVHDYGADANPVVIELLNDRLLTDLLELQVLCTWAAPYGIDLTIDAYDGQNPIEQDVWVAQWQMEIAEAHNEISAYEGSNPIYDGQPFPGLWSKGKRTLDAINAVRAPAPPAYAAWVGPSGGRI
jgi:hypothetical protein